MLLEFAPRLLGECRLCGVRGCRMVWVDERKSWGNSCQFCQNVFHRRRSIFWVSRFVIAPARHFLIGTSLGLSPSDALAALFRGADELQNPSKATVELSARTGLDLIFS